MNDLFPNAGGFDVIPVPGGYQLIDLDTFNCWKSISRFTFATADAATDYAWKCWDFKTGHRWNLDDPT